MNSKKNYAAVSAALQFVKAQHGFAIQKMGGATVLTTVILAAITTGSMTLGQAADKVEQALAKTLNVTIAFLASLIGLGGVRDVVLKILNRLT